jgi:UPF0042 nucleotide-binding protein
MTITIITGLSGAGKSQAKKVFEDLNYYCIDNMPPPMVRHFADLIKENEDLEKIALVLDIRGRSFFSDLDAALNWLEENGIKHNILFLEASDEVLVRRFKEARRSHPIDPSLRLERAIEQERRELQSLRQRADAIIDTSAMNLAALKKRVRYVMDEREDTEGEMQLQLISFGFKRGVPTDADFIFDLRFLPNPYYVEHLRHLSGNDVAVQDYVMQFEESVGYFERIKDLLGFVIPKARAEGRQQLVVAVGCTGGRHRSVTFANHLARLLRDEVGDLQVVHRDLKEA